MSWRYSQADRLVEQRDLDRVQLAQRAWPLVAELHVADLGADQPGHRVPDLAQQPPDDVLAALVQHDLDDRPRRRARRRRRRNRPSPGRRPVRRRPAADGPDRAESARASRPCRSSDTPYDGWVSRCASSPSLVSSSRPSESMSSRPTWNSRSARSSSSCPMCGPTQFVGHRRQHAGHLVQRQVDLVLADHDPVAVDVHDGLVGVDPQAHLPDDDAVDLDPAGPDQLLGLAPGGDAGGRQHLLQPDPPSSVASARRRRPAGPSERCSDIVERIDVGEQGTERRAGPPASPAPAVRGTARWSRYSRPPVSGSAPTSSIRPRDDQGADDAVDVDAADAGDPGPGDRLPIGDHGQRLQRRAGQPRLLRRRARTARPPARTGPGCRTASRRRSPAVRCRTRPRSAGWASRPAAPGRTRRAGGRPRRPARPRRPGESTTSRTASSAPASSSSATDRRPARCRRSSGPASSRQQRPSITVDSALWSSRSVGAVDPRSASVIIQRRSLVLLVVRRVGTRRPGRHRGGRDRSRSSVRSAPPSARPGRRAPRPRRYRFSSPRNRATTSASRRAFGDQFAEGRPAAARPAAPASRRCARRPTPGCVE